MALARRRVALLMPSTKLIMAVLVAGLLTGCALVREPTRTPRTAIEQLLLSQAMTRSLKHLSVPLAPHESVTVEIAGFSNDRALLETVFPSTSTVAIGTPPPLPMVRGHASDLPVMQGKIEGRLGELGLSIPRRTGDARYFLRVTVEALGTEQGESFFGMPPVQSVLLPFALPELTLFKAQYQHAYVRFTIDVFDMKTGEMVGGTPWYEGTAYYNQYTVFFFFVFERSDLIAPP